VRKAENMKTLRFLLGVSAIAFFSLALIFIFFEIFKLPETPFFKVLSIIMVCLMCITVILLFITVNAILIHGLWEGIHARSWGRVMVSVLYLFVAYFIAVRGFILIFYKR
jgi:hypothetical protein